MLIFDLQDTSELLPTADPSVLLTASAPPAWPASTSSAPTPAWASAVSTPGATWWLTIPSAAVRTVLWEILSPPADRDLVSTFKLFIFNQTKMRNENVTNNNLTLTPRIPVT